MSEQTIVLIVFVAGVLARVIIPYTLEWLDDKRPWEWRYLAGQALGAAAGLFFFLVDDSFVADMVGSTLLSVFATGYVFTEAGRKVQKLAENL